MSELNFVNGRILTGGKFQSLNLRARDGRIAQIGGEPMANCPTIDLQGQMLVPGFIDIHTHGGGGTDVNAADADGFAAISRFFAAQGTTGWLCSILTDTEEATTRAIREAVSFMKREPSGARLLGIHLEGPFLAPEYKGAMPESLLKAGDPALIERYQTAAEGNIRYLTVAPETPGAIELIRQISPQIPIAIGHTGASYERAIEAIEAGARAATHTFNAMGLFHQHRPGVMGAVLERPVICEAICDGRHLHPGAVRMLLACKGWERVVAITDSIQAAGLPDGKYKLGVNDVVVEDGDALLADTRVRAGSTLTMQQALRNLVAFTGEGVEKVVRLMTENPARLIGLQGKGEIKVGNDADFAVLDDQLYVQATYVEGKKVWSK